MAYRNVVRNPTLQARIFLPNFFLRVVRPGRELPDNEVQFHVPLDMGKIDIRNYLEKIYNIRVERVTTRIQLGPTRKVLVKGLLKAKKFPDIKVAYVTLAEGTFKFPDLFPKLQRGEEEGEKAETAETSLTQEKIEEESKAHLDSISKPWFQ